MPIWLIVSALGGGFLLLNKKAPGPTATPPVPSKNGTTTTSAQPGIASYLTQALQGLGIGSKPAPQNVNQSQYGGNKAFMGAPATPISTQAQVVGALGGAAGISTIWDKLSGSDDDSDDSSDSPGGTGGVSNSNLDPTPNLGDQSAYSGYDQINAYEAWDSASSTTNYDSGYDDIAAYEASDNGSSYSSDYTDYSSDYSSDA